MKRLRRRADLLEDVHAVAALFDHLREAANLPLDAAKARDQVALPYGNSTQQNRVSGLVSTTAVSRPADRVP